jgi:phospholipid/cholesterol/gamma-HCH transport system substrate-binding protein
MPRSQHWKAGLFVILASLLVVAAVGLIAGLRLTAPRQRYFIRFEESVSGLEMGAAVKYRGVDVGNVTAIKIPKDDLSKVEVEISVGTEIPIKTDTKATLSSTGITGLKFVELTAGSIEAPKLPPGSNIPSEMSFFGSLSGTAATAAEKLDILLANLIYITDRQKVDKLTGQIESVLNRVNESTGEASTLIANANLAALRLESLLNRADMMLGRNEGHFDSIMVDIDLALTSFNATVQEIHDSGLITNASMTAAHTAEISSSLREVLVAHRRSLSEAILNLRETSANLNDFSRFVRDQPSLLLRSSPPETPNVPGMKKN